MDGTYTFLTDIVREFAPPEAGMTTRPFLTSDRLKAVGFGFAAGASLTEHTAPFPAVLQILSGEATLTLGKEHKDVSAGAWVYMPARLTHAIRAKTPVTMLLLLLK
jgi:quercetin dioxygenase-like cupin family protein